VRLSLRPTSAALVRPPFSPDRQLSDEELLARLRRDDVRALEAILARDWSMVVDYVARLTGSADAAEDVVQRAFCQLWERRGQLRPVGSLRALLCKIARNYAITEHRRARADERTAAAFNELSWLAQASDDRIEVEQLRSTLDREIARLPARRREVLVLRCVHDLSYKEIAEVMDISPQTVANQLSKALAMLRVSLGGALDEQ
jgi:RNA polymerase sigma-70 factor (ECF subfamily)